MEFNYYQILGVSTTAKEEEIKSAYKNLAKKYHPDRHPGNSFYEEHFKKINVAYQTLSDAEKRKRYDLKLTYSTQKKTTPATGTATPRPHTSYRPSERPGKPRESATAREDRKRMIRYSVITALLFAIFITGAVFFYNYMNRVTAKDRLWEGKILEGNRQFFPALEYYTEALSYDPELAEAYVRRAHLRVATAKDFTGGAADYSKAIKYSERPDYNLFFLRAKCYLRIEEYEKGLQDINTALELHPGADTLHFYKAEINNYFKKNYRASIQDYNEALRLNPDFHDALFGRAYAWYNMGEYAFALQDFNKLIGAAPKEGSYYYYRAFSRFYLNDRKGACDDWRQALQTGFTDAKAAMAHNCGR